MNLIYFISPPPPHTRQHQTNRGVVALLYTIFAFFSPSFLNLHLSRNMYFYTLSPGRAQGSNDLRGGSAGVAGVAGLHSPEDFGPLAEAAVVEADRIRKGIRCDIVVSRCDTVVNKCDIVAKRVTLS